MHQSCAEPRDCGLAAAHTWVNRTKNSPPGNKQNSYPGLRKVQAGDLEGADGAGAGSGGFLNGQGAMVKCAPFMVLQLFGSTAY